MKLLFTALITLVIATVAALFAQQDTGYVLINYRQWSIEMSLVLMCALTVAAFFILYYVVRSISGTRRIQAKLGNWKQNRRITRARSSASNGMIQLAEGQWVAAEQNLIKHIRDNDNPLLNYLGAARAAQQQGATQRRDKYLAEAYQQIPKAKLAIGITKAELQLNQGQMEQALATLSSLRAAAPKNNNVLKLLAKIYAELHDWGRLTELLPELDKRDVLPREKLKQLEQTAYSGLLNSPSSNNDSFTLNNIWHRMPKGLRQDETLLLEYAHQLISCNEIDQAETLLHQALNKDWHDSLAYLYGITEASDPAKQLRRAESWLKLHKDNPVLLLTLGRLCIRNELWGKARQYLETSASISNQPETCKELGELLEKMGEIENATAYYRKGLQLISPPSKKLAATKEHDQPSDDTSGTDRLPITAQTTA